MDTLQMIVLGLIQGLTEFIPVSSSGHLVIAQEFMKGASSHQLLEFINLGTLLALVVYYRGRLMSILRNVIEQKKYSLLRNIILTSVPAGVAGFLLSDFIGQSSFFGSVVVVIVTLAVVGVIMIFADRLPSFGAVESGENLSWRRALGIGVAQMFALIPGVSRSGSTIIAGKIAGLSNKEAADYSFLASLPIMLAVTVKVFLKPADRAYFVEHMPLLLVGNIVAFVAGILAIRFLLSFLSKHDLKIFGWYRVGLAAVVLLVILLQ